MTSWKDCSSFSAFLEGVLIPKPPCHAGKAKRAHSWSLGVGLPVRAGSSSVLNVVSSGINR